MLERLLFFFFLLALDNLLVLKPIMVQHFVEGEPVLLLLLQHVLDEFDGARRNLLPVLISERGVCVDSAVDNDLLVLRIKWKVTDQQHVNYDADTPDVNALVV